MPLGSGSEDDEHIIDRPIPLVETLASVYDKRRSIADLDIRKALESPLLLRVQCAKAEDHRMNDDQRGVVYFDQFQDANEVVANDNWDEILEKNEGPISVIRAKDNWLARLAAAAVCVQQGRTSLLLPGNGDICWRCCQMHLDKNEALRTLMIA